MDTIQVFDRLSLKIGQLLFGRTEGDRNIISKTLDELNSLNYRYPVVTNPTKAVLLVNHCCSFVPPDDEVLVSKCCQLLSNLIQQQSIIIEGRTLTVSIQWCLQALKNGERNTILEVLRALEALLRNNVQNVPMLTDTVIKEIKSQINLKKNDTEKNSLEVTLLAIQCLEACTVFPNDPKSSNTIKNFLPYMETCADIFTSFLCVKRSLNCIIYCKILEACLIGLQNIVTLHSIYLQKELGSILGIIKTYMLYNIKDVDFIIPQKLMPSTLSIPEISSNSLREKTGGKVTKQRKHRTSGAHKKKEKRNTEEVVFDSKNSGYVPATFTLEYNSDSGIGHASTSNGRLKTSDSDFSDNESGRLAKLNHSSAKVRQAALNLFHNVVKNTEKPTVFSYWSSFMPEGPMSGRHNLITCILRDPSARGRMAALNVLLLLLTSSKMYLAQAESSDKNTSFTPFSVVLGLTITELHRGLSLALNQMSVPVLAQVLKCLAALAQATPYHRMTSGLVTKIIRNVKPLISHKDASVQVTALIVMGCLLASEPVISETEQAMVKLQKQETPTEKPSQTDKEKDKNRNSAGVIDCDSFDYAQFSSDEEEVDNSVEVASMPWLLQKCLTNLGVSFKEKGKEPLLNIIEKVIPAPVKLESLQILSAMSRNYFDFLMAPHLSYITKALELSLTDKYTDLRLHAGRAVDFIGQAMNRFIENEDSSCLNFWQTLLNGSLVSLLQNEQHATLRAVGCDCLGSIGPSLFQQLPRDKQILCITLLFASARDEENSVRGAAVRALALCVLYPSLREDPGFVVDTAEAVHKALNDENLTVRIKASWSLGNLSDALVLNSKSSESIEDLPEKIFLKLLLASIKSSSDYDKIKMNVVRAIGNLVLMVDGNLMRKVEFKDACQQALSALVKNCMTGTNMKVRWNACYALGNALKNSALYSELDVNVWQPSIFNKLTELVVGFRNFKVRINASVALSSPTAREHYGQFFIPVWTTLLKALENSENMEDFLEYKHRDHLVEQLCLALGHLTTLLTKEDLPQLEDPLNLYFDTFKIHMHKVLERLVPEKSTELFSALCFLNTLESSSDVYGTRDRKVIQCLKSVFVLDI